MEGLSKRRTPDALLAGSQGTIPERQIRAACHRPAEAHQANRANDRSRHGLTLVSGTERRAGFIRPSGIIPSGGSYRACRKYLARGSFHHGHE